MLGVDQNAGCRYDTSAQIGIDAGSDYQALQQIMVHITAADLDVMVSDTDCLMRYAYQVTILRMMEPMMITAMMPPTTYHL